MSEAENLLDQLSENGTSAYTADPTTEPHIVIGSDRYITVPDELKHIGVQYDHNIETVKFDCPRYWDGIDMSKFHVYVNYMRSDGGVGMYLAEDVTIDETDETIMHFSWILSGNVTKTKGALSFLVCAKSVDEDGNEVNHWNSELNREMIISEGLECQETILDQYPDIITSLLTRMDKVDLQAHETKEYVDAALESFNAISTETKEYVDNAIASSDADLTGYATEAYVDGKIADVNATLENYVTKDEALNTQEYLEGLILANENKITAVENNIGGELEIVKQDVINMTTIDGGFIAAGTTEPTSDINAVLYVQYEE